MAGGAASTWELATTSTLPGKSSALGDSAGSTVDSAVKVDGALAPRARGACRAASASQTDVRQRHQLGDELFDLALRPMRGPREDRLAVLRGEQRHEQRHPGEVEPSVAEHREQPGCRRAARATVMRR